MSDIKETIEGDLSELAVQRIDQALRSVLQLVDDHKEAYGISVVVCAYTFGFAARLLERLGKKEGRSDTFADYVDATVEFIAERAKETPPDDVRGAQ